MRMARRLETADRDAQMYILHKENVPHEAIAKRFDVSTATVGKGIQRAIHDTFRFSADEDRMVLADQIDALMFKLRRLLAEPQYMVSVSGKVVINPVTGEPLVDRSHEVRVMESLRKFMDMRAKLLGLNMPVRHRVEITDKMDDEIERLASELMLHGAGSGIPAELPAGEIVNGEVEHDSADAGTG